MFNRRKVAALEAEIVKLKQAGLAYAEAADREVSRLRRESQDWFEKYMLARRTLVAERRLDDVTKYLVDQAALQNAPQPLIVEDR